VTGNISFTVTLGMALAVSILANLLNKGELIMSQICVTCMAALARGQVCLCPCIVAGHDFVL